MFKIGGDDKLTFQYTRRFSQDLIASTSGDFAIWSDAFFLRSLRCEDDCFSTLNLVLNLCISGEEGSFFSYILYMHT